MPTLRAFAASMVTPVAAPKLRAFAASLTGATPTTPTLRVYSASFTGAANVTISPIPDRIVEPGSVVTITPVLSGTPDSLNWRQVSGPTVTLSGTGPSRSFVAPSDMPPGATVVIGVTPVVNGIAGAEVQSKSDVLPQTQWSRVPGGQWVGANTVAV